MESVSYITRMGKTIEADEVFHAWTSYDLDRMIRALPLKTNPIDRHFLLQSIVQLAYKQRTDLKMRKLCKEVAEKHIDEFKKIAPVLKEHNDGWLPNISSFKHLAIVLTEDGEFDRAIKVCKKAIKYGLHDGTKAGFEGRIESIKKKIRK